MDSLLNLKKKLRDSEYNQDFDYLINFIDLERELGYFGGWRNCWRNFYLIERLEK